MALAIDGKVLGTASAANLTVSLTTTSTNDVIIVVAACNGGPVVSVTSPNLTFTRRGGTTGGFCIEEWWAPSSGTLSAEQIKVTQTTSGVLAVTAFGISGANTSTPYDTHSGLPVTANGSQPSVSTSNANDIILGMFRLTSSTGTIGSGFSSIENGDFMLVEYKIVSSTQTSLSVTETGTNNGAIGDAIVQATAATNASITGVSSTGGTGTLSIEVDTGATGVESTSDVGTLTVQNSETLTGVSSTSGVGSLSISEAKTLTGISITSGIGTLSVQDAFSISGVSSTSGVGTLSA